MPAEFFGTVFAPKGRVLAFVHALGVLFLDHFPRQEERERDQEQTLGINERHESAGGEHHQIVPVIYAAGRAALVFHYKFLEGAVKQYADKVADREKKTDKNDGADVYDRKLVKRGYDRRYKRPQGEHDSRPSLFIRRGLVPRRSEVFAEDLLTARAFEGRREKAQQHIGKKEYPYKPEHQRITFQKRADVVARSDRVTHVRPQSRKKKQTSRREFYSMKYRYMGKYYLFFYSPHKPFILPY